MVMAAFNSSYELPPLPEYTLHPLPPLISWIPDNYLSMALLFIAYWATSGIFHVIDVFDLFPQYRLHTPAEVLKRNHVSRWEVFRDVIIQQIVQTAFGIFLATFDEDPTFGKEDYDVAWYAQRIRLAQRAVPSILTIVGINPVALAMKTSESMPMLAGALAGGKYRGLVQTVTFGGQQTVVPAFASWELSLARFLYIFLVPAFQFLLAITIVDTWQYFLHRAMHLNRWMYGKQIAPFYASG